MIPKIRSIVIITNIALVLLAIGLQVLGKEKLRNTGELFFFKLAPVDPRSLMQGDYMELRYKITRTGRNKNIPSRGYIIFTVDSNKVAHYIRHQKKHQPLHEGEKCIKYFYHKREISIGVESFFFQEGHANAFSKAEYGALKVDNKGEKILVGLFNDKFQEIKP